MKTWKLILATLVIFVAGIVTGATVAHRLMTAVKSPIPRQPEGVGRNWMMQRPEFLQRLKTELRLTSEQADKVAVILRQSNQRIEPLWELIGPLLQEETAKVRQEIKAVLTPEQQKQFEELAKPRMTRRNDGDLSKGRPNATTGGASKGPKPAPQP
ncbi:MAG: hypothetical protein WCO56_01110 [Verrucomicrobiota bacterium]